MKRKLIIFTSLTLYFITPTFSQGKNNPFSLSYSTIGKGSTDNNEEISISNYDVEVSFPMPLKTKKFMMMNSLRYGSTDISYGTTIDTEAKIDRFQNISYTLGYMRPLQNDWRLMIMMGPSVSSNFDSGIDFDELKFQMMAMFSKQINPKLELSFGAMYKTNGQFQFPLPVIGIHWKPNEKWDIGFGVPHMGANYIINEKTTVGISAFMDGNDFTLSKPSSINNSKNKVNNLKYNNFGAGLNFEQKLYKLLKFKVTGGYTFSRNLKFQNDYDDVYEMKPDNSFFIKAGISLTFD